jgi:phosphoglycolate phosphatase-like HAD superfamily hydrolase
MTTLVSFDVDGTLIRTVGSDANKLHKQAFSAAWREVFGIETNVDVIQHHGNTDPLILIRVLQHHGIPKTEATAKLKEMEAVMVEHYRQHADKAGVGLQLLPGVQQLLKALQDMPNVLTCLVTGNLEPIGWAKMEALGIRDLFSNPRFGGFGSDYCNPDNANITDSWRDRAELVRVAHKKALQLHPGTSIVSRIHVGDTPMDIQAADEGGAAALGVLTGIYPKTELQAASQNGAVILDDLSNIQQVMQVLQLS